MSSTDDSLWRQRFDATLRAAVDAIITIDTRGIIETVNLAAENMFGYSEQELIGQNVDSLMPEPYASEHGGYLAHYLDTGEAKIIGIGREVEGRRKDGTIFPMDLAVGEGVWAGKRFFVGLLRDLTQRRHLEGRLEEREQELRWVHDHGLAATATLDLDGRFRIVNRACCRLFGGSEPELIGRPFGELSHPDDRTSAEQAVRALISGEKSALQLRHRCLNSKGEVVHGHLHLSTIHDPSGAPIRLVAQVFDRTDQVLAERRALETQERLAHVNRLSTLGEMAGAIAHEVNQPLGAISNYAQALLMLLQRDGEDRDRLAAIAEKIGAQALRAGDVIRRLRNLAKRHEGGRSPADINRLVEEIVRLAELDARLQSVRIELDLDASLPKAVVDEVQIQQVVLNLMRNGIESMAESRVESPWLRVRTGHSDLWARIEVSDRGGGVSPELESQILDPFVSSKDSGMGLGLSICQSIVTAHGGELGFEARDGGGATFFFTLPINEDDDSEATSRELESQFTPRDSHRSVSPRSPERA